jgi:hypothetical protein
MHVTPIVSQLAHGLDVTSTSVTPDFRSKTDTSHMCDRIKLHTYDRRHKLIYQKAMFEM